MTFKRSLYFLQQRKVQEKRHPDFIISSIIVSDKYTD